MTDKQQTLAAKQYDMNPVTEFQYCDVKEIDGRTLKVVVYRHRSRILNRLACAKSGGDDWVLP